MVRNATRTRGIVAGALVLGLGQACLANNFLVNPGFESGLTGWSGWSGTPTNSVAASDAGVAHSGTGYATGATLPSLTTQSLVQNFAPIDTGTITETSFWYRQVNPSLPSPSLYAYYTFFNGTSGSNAYAPVTVIGDGQWHQVFFGSPGTGSSFIGFGALAQNLTSGPGSALMFDDFKLSTSPIPEPAAASLLTFTAAGLLLRRRR